MHSQNCPGLLHRDPWGHEQLVPLPGMLVAGRDKRAGLSIADPAISAFHCLLLSLDTPSSWILVDLHSRNGTYLNGVRVRRPVKLRQGDRVQLGRSHLIMLHLQPNAPADGGES